MTARPEETATLQGRETVLRPASDGFSREELQTRFRWSQDQELQYWSGNIPSARTFDEFVRILPERDWPSDGRRRSYAVLTLEGELIGMVSCYSIDWDARTGELGVYIGERRLWNQGLGTDAIGTLLGHLFADLEFGQVCLNTYTTNVRAIKSYSKVGFKKVGSRRRFRPSVGYYREVRMVIDRTDFST